MTLKELHIFYELCEDTHISRLAQRIGITQSAISLSIKSLERQIGEPLFDRIGKKLILNEIGRLFKEKTYSHYIALSDAENFFKESKVSGILNIASSRTIGAFITPQTVYDFLEQHPNAVVKKDIHNSQHIVNLVKDATIDMGFIESNCDDEEIEKEIIGRDRMLVVTSDKRLKGATCYIDELFDRQWILREKGSGTREIFLEAIGDISKEIKILMEFSEFAEAKTILLKNPQTITCLSQYAIEKELKRGELFEVKLKNISIERSFYLIYHKKKYQSKLFLEFRKFAKRFFVI
ncbi:LysR family transcriptional regulator [Sulfurospirillum sp. 1612]|uniref:LysR family transcriptional regulator n=1 Tax=Sulfurospirillum sp. 1612 TaxID=3094835 RepID=UPI002F950AAA